MLCPQTGRCCGFFGFAAPSENVVAGEGVSRFVVKDGVQLRGQAQGLRRDYPMAGWQWQWWLPWDELDDRLG